MAVARSRSTCRARWPPRAPIVGLDLGEKTIGVAVSDIGLHDRQPART